MSDTYSQQKAEKIIKEFETIKSQFSAELIKGQSKEQLDKTIKKLESYQNAQRLKNIIAAKKQKNINKALEYGLYGKLVKRKEENSLFSFSEIAYEQLFKLYITEKIDNKHIAELFDVSEYQVSKKRKEWNIMIKKKLSLS